MKFLATVTSVIVVASGALMSAQSGAEAARFMDGSIPRMPPLASAGGDVVLSVAVSSAGVVDSADVLRSTPPFTETLLEAVRTWKFAPARDAKRRPLDSRVLVDAVVGSPSM